MTGIELVGFGITVVIAMGIVIGGFLSKLGEIEGPQDIIDSIRKENDTRDILYDRIEALEEKLRVSAELMTEAAPYIKELKELRQDFFTLQDLAMWMTGCGYNFIEHPYFLVNKYLMTKGVNGEEMVERLEKGAELVGERNQEQED